jgi:hypothetical protein
MCKYSINVQFTIVHLSVVIVVNSIFEPKKLFPVILFHEFSGFLQYDALYIGTYVPIFRGNVLG